jgi:hypothetical protein
MELVKNIWELCRNIYWKIKKAMKVCGKAISKLDRCGVQEKI